MILIYNLILTIYSYKKMENPGIDPGTSQMLSERALPSELIRMGGTPASL